jgi:hypothetical protein
MKKPVNELLEHILFGRIPADDFTKAPPACARPREATMDKTNRTFLTSSAHDANPGCTFANASFEAALYVKDNRLAQLLVLLRQLSDAAGGLGTLPHAELGEIVSSAVAVSGFVNPIEAEEVIAAVLEAFDTLPRPPIYVPLE